MRPSKSDSIFQLSLTEIAFALVFILLILLGWMYADSDRKYQETLLEKEKLENLATLQQQFDAVRSALAEQLQVAGANPDEIISQLVNNSKAVAESATLHMRIQDMNEQISELASIRELLERVKASPIGAVSHTELIAAVELTNKLVERVASMVAERSSVRPTSDDKEGIAIREIQAPSGGVESLPKPDIGVVETELLTALTFMQELERAYKKQFNESLVRDKNHEFAKVLVEALRTNSAKENSDLRGQVAYLQARLSSGQGRDHPPCWANEVTGRIEYLFDIVISQDGLAISSAWPGNRQSDADELPGVKQISGRTLSKAAFASATSAILNASKERNCRHFVILRSRVNDLGVFNDHRFAVSNVFYTYEPRN